MQGNDWWMLLIALILCAVGFVLMKADVKTISKSAIIYSAIMVAIVIAITVTLQVVYENNSFIFNVKRVCLLSLLWPIAFIDYKDYRIPNPFIITGLIYRAIILAFELIFENTDLLHTVVTELIAAGALVLAAILCRLCIKNSVGAGDIKLFIIMGIMLGLNGIWSAIFMSLIVSFFISGYLLLTKKMTRKDSIPFGPALVIGAYLSIFLTGM